MIYSYRLVIVTIMIIDLIKTFAGDFEFYSLQMNRIWLNGTI